MKTFEAKSLELEELSLEDSRLTNGGLVREIIEWALGCIAWDILSDPQGAKSSFKKGIEVNYY